MTDGLHENFRYNGVHGVMQAQDSISCEQQNIECEQGCEINMM